MPTLTAVSPDDLLLMPDRGQGYELVDGELVEMGVSYLSSFTAGEVYGALRDFFRPRKLGWLAPESTSFRCFPDDPDRVRRADTAFHTAGRFTAAQAATEGHCTVVPDLVVEVVSPNDLADEVERKRAEWLDAGARLVWVVFPLAKTVHTYAADGPSALLRNGDALTGGAVLPGFSVPVASLFPVPV